MSQVERCLWVFSVFSFDVVVTHARYRKNSQWSGETKHNKSNVWIHKTKRMEKTSLRFQYDFVILSLLPILNFFYMDQESWMCSLTLIYVLLLWERQHLREESSHWTTGEDSHFAVLCFEFFYLLRIDRSLECNWKKTETGGISCIT